MIIQDEVEIHLNSNQTYDAVKYWTEKGYTNLKPQQKLLVKVSDLPSFSSAKIMFKCDHCEIEWKRCYSKKFASHKLYPDKDLCHRCSRKQVGEKVGRANAILAGKKNCGENHHNFNPNKSDFKAYAYKVRQITEKTYDEYIHIINPDNLPRTLCGVKDGYQLDHRVSIKWGYEHGLNPKIMGSLDNLQLLTWEENRIKW